MTWLSRSSPVCRPVAGLGTKAAQHTNVHNPGLTITHPAPTRYAACCVSSAARLR